MIPYETDPSLHNAEPEPASLDDGFSPPLPHGAVDAEGGSPAQPATPLPLPGKSAF